MNKVYKIKCDLICMETSKKDVLSLLKKYKIPIADYALIKNKEELLRCSKKIGFPCVLKVWDERYIHKTDIGGVILDILDEKMLLQSYEHMIKKFSPEAVFLQKQVKKGAELYIGIKKDETFGHVLLFGLGGVYVEIFKDISQRICPITKKDFHDMVEELKAKKILLGYRGKQVDLEKLASLCVSVSKMAVSENINELDLNPVKADEKDCTVLDARVKF